jgi:alpha-L-fucosidase
MPEGRLEPRQVERLKEMGHWLSKYGTSIYDTRGGPWKPTKALASTRRDKSIFLHVLKWEGNSISLPGIPAQIQHTRVLTGGKAQVQQEGDKVIISLPPGRQQPIDTIIRLDLDRSAMSLKPVGFPSTIKATASNVYQGMEEYAAESALDGDPGTRWATDGGTKQAWVALQLPRATLIDGVKISEALAPRVQKFEFQYRNGGEWKTLFSGTEIGAAFSRSFAPVTAAEVRLNILDATEGPTIWEIELSQKKKP